VSKNADKIPENLCERTLINKQIAEKLLSEQNEFNKFLKVVKEDIESKAECWMHVKEDSSTKQRGYATLQVHALGIYSRRIERFEKLIIKSWVRLQNGNANADKDEDPVESHFHMLRKMKRRMKQMMDVSDRHAVPPLLSAVNPRFSACESLVSPGLDYMSDSITSLDSYIDSSFIQFSNGFSKESFNCSNVSKRRAFYSSLWDHACALSKCYTEIS